MNIGYTLNSEKLFKMMNIINAIDYIKRAAPTGDEVIKILQQYEQ